MIKASFEILWFLLPAILANMAPVFAAHYRWLPQLNRPLDGRRTWRNQRLLGDNKTVRGLAVGLIIGSITSFIQYLLLPVSWLPGTSLIIHTSAAAAISAGAWLGFGALLGDAVASFIKRQQNRAPGTTWHPWDQIDFVLGALFVSWWLIPLTIVHVVIALTLLGFGSYLTSVIGIKLKIKKSL